MRPRLRRLPPPSSPRMAFRGCGIGFQSCLALTELESYRTPTRLPEMPSVGLATQTGRTTRLRRSTYPELGCRPVSGCAHDDRTASDARGPLAAHRGRG